MNTNTKLPDCIRAERIGHWSHGSQSECDAYGERAPITWFCCCGSRLTLEVIDLDTEMYVTVPQQRREKFLADHSECEIVCFTCQIAPVERAGMWCDKCMWD
jgi:hypothetical protein